MLTLEWEELQSEPALATCIRRAKVPGGWLVSATENVCCVIPSTENGQYTGSHSVESGYDWRTSLTFVPDPNHEWEVAIDG